MADFGKDSTASGPRTQYLEDYQPPAYLVEDITLRFELDPAATRVTSRLTAAAQSPGLSLDSLERAGAPGPFLEAVESAGKGPVAPVQLS